MAELARSKKFNSVSIRLFLRAFSIFALKKREWKHFLCLVEKHNKVQWRETGKYIMTYMKSIKIKGNSVSSFAPSPSAIWSNGTHMRISATYSMNQLLISTFLLRMNTVYWKSMQWYKNCKKSIVTSSWWLKV